MEKLINDWSSSSCCSDDHSRHLHVWSRCCGEDQEGHHGERHLSTEVGPGTEGTPGVIDPLSLNITASSVNSEKFLLINNKFVCSGESEEDDDSERTPRQTRETEWQHAGRLEESIRRLQVHRTWGGRAHSGFYSRTGGWFPATVRSVCRQLSLGELTCSLRESVCYRNFQLWAFSLSCLLKCSPPENSVIRCHHR